MRPEPEHYTRILKTETSSEEMRKSKLSILVNGVIFSTREHVFGFENETSFRIYHQNSKPAALIHHPENSGNLKKILQKPYEKVSKVSICTLNFETFLKKLVNSEKVSQAKGSLIKIYIF